MNKYLCAIISAMFAVFVLIGGWWVARVERNLEVLQQLQWKDYYLNGQVKAAPVAPPSGPGVK